MAVGGCGPGPLAGALSRFTAAWSGELVSWAFGGQELSLIAAENGHQLMEVSGLAPRPGQPGFIGPVAPTRPGQPGFIGPVAPKAGP